jgi:hypothetical protein
MGQTYVYKTEREVKIWRGYEEWQKSVWRESHVISERFFALGVRKNAILLEGSHASPSCPSDEGSKTVMTSEWLKLVVSERDSEI